MQTLLTKHSLLPFGSQLWAAMIRCLGSWTSFLFWFDFCSCRSRCSLRSFSSGIVWRLESQTPVLQGLRESHVSFILSLTHSFAHPSTRCFWISVALGCPQTCQVADSDLQRLSFLLLPPKCHHIPLTTFKLLFSKSNLFNGHVTKRA